MGQFRRRIFNTPVLGSKLMPTGDSLQLGALGTAGFVTGAGTGMDAWADPIPAADWAFFNGMVVCRRFGATGINERRPAWDASFLADTEARQNLTSIVFKFTAVGFDPAGSITPVMDTFLCNGWSSPDNYQVQTEFAGGIRVRITPPAGGVFFIGLVNALDAFNNTIKINIQRMNTKTKRCTVWIYDSSTAAWLTATQDWVGLAGVGEILYCPLILSGGANQCLDSGTSYVGISYLQVSTSDISLLGHEPLR